MGAPLLEIDNLKTYFHSRSKQAFIRAVDGVTIAIARGETLSVVGESGSGKSVTALSIVGLIGAGPGVISGKIVFRADGSERNLLQDLEDYVTLGERDGRIMKVSKDESGWEENVERILAEVRGKAIAMIFQNPKSALNPFVTVGDQITEAIRLHTPKKDPKEAKARALDWLERVKIDSPRLRFDNYPYALSGGMCQRVMIAMALSSEPSLLIADEPTTGLDATIQSKIVGLLGELKAELGITTLLISHDIRVVSRLADSVAVMYGGTVVEYGPAADVLAAGFAPKHPYTAALLASIPSVQNVREKGYLPAIEGEVPDPIETRRGCRFYGRCNRVTDDIREQCARHEPELKAVMPGHHVRCWLYVD
ncbi:MAG TPA: ABC transporter ATP-binding protein [Methylomirabilota bacterium]|jgi:oligopeptide/dipeptide ABC transporter ATP-binding protein|nr:ABC transporter ATP-binding protein [Methylomirabilota bacterium]